MTETRGSDKSVPAIGPLDTLGSAQIRAQHTALMIRLLWRERSISRADLARHTGLSRSTVSAIINDVLETRLVRESGSGESKGGRRPIMLTFDDEAFAIAGIDMGASHVGVAITNLRGEVRAWHTRPHRVQADPEGTLALIDELFGESLRDAGITKKRILGIGVAVPSPVNPRHPGRLLPLILPKWRDLDLVELLVDKYGLPVFVDNDANLGALAEHWWGAGIGVSNLAWVKVATGVGAGILVDGKIYRGGAGIAGEIGHTAIDRRGPKCICGLDGCLTTFVGAGALLDQVKARRDEGTALPVRGLTLERLIDAAIDGDALARDIVRGAGVNLGIGIANLLNLLNPQMVVLGGALLRVGDLLLDPLRETLATRSLSESIAHAEVVQSTLGEPVTAIGAATFVLQAALEDLSLFPVPHLRGSPR
ncbi:ROK family protein [Myxococcota bacterium]|nr:ROK family protein [Myxococcota bacterium]